MSKVVLFLSILFLSLPVLAKEAIVRFFCNDYDRVYNINDIEKINFQSLKLGTKLIIYQNSSNNTFNVADIDSISFGLNNFQNQILNLYQKGIARTFELSKVDSINIKPMINDTVSTVTIGTQVWMKYNLNVSHYRNGDSIPEVRDSLAWMNLTTGAWCFFNNDSNNGKIYGRLYNWYAVNDPRGLAPEGWHLPRDDDFGILSSYLGGDSLENDVGGKLKEEGILHWKIPNKGATNETGFNAIPGGYRNYNDGIFYSINKSCIWWSSTKYDETYSFYWFVVFDSDQFYRGYYSKLNGDSIRCLKD